MGPKFPKGECNREECENFHGLVIAAELFISGITSLQQDLLMKEGQMLAEKRTLRGRQVYWLIIQHKKSSEGLGVIYNIQDLVAIKWMGDKNLATFY